MNILLALRQFFLYTQFLIFLDEQHFAKCKEVRSEEYRRWDNKRKLLYGQLRERARWTKSRAVIGYPSGQDGAILESSVSRK